MAGTARLLLEDMVTKERESVLLDSHSQDYGLVFIPPSIAHSVQNIGEEDAVVIVFSRTPEDPEDTLPFRLDLSHQEKTGRLSKTRHTAGVLKTTILSYLPQPFGQLHQFIVPLQPRLPPVRQGSEPPARPGQCTTTRTNSIRVPAKVDRGKDRHLCRLCKHEGMQGRMRAENRIQGGNPIVLIITPQHRMHLIICTKGPCMPERSSPRYPPAHIAYHYVQKRGAVAPDRVIMRDPGAGNAHIIHFQRRIKNPEREAPHHAAIRPASMLFFMDNQCGMVRQGPGTDKIKEES